MSTEQSEALDQIRVLAESFDGVVGVAAKDFGSGTRLKYNAETIFPTASTFKTALLYELYRQVDQGIIDPAMRITFEDRQRVPGSGVLQDLDAGAMLTVKDIATLMIVVSDNAGTDIIYDLIGRAPVAATLARLGMTQTHLPLDCWEILAGMQNLDPADPSLTYDDLKRSLDETEAPWENSALNETPENDISTPNDLLHLVETIHKGDGLSAASRDAVIDILKRQKFAERIPALLPFGVQVAHKTGSIKGVRNDIGIVYAGSTTYGIALMSKRAENGVAATELLAKLSKVVYDAFVGKDGGAA